jgi:hypothetical protein
LAKHLEKLRYSVAHQPDSIIPEKNKKKSKNLIVMFFFFIPNTFLTGHFEGSIPNCRVSAYILLKTGLPEVVFRKTHTSISMFKNDFTYNPFAK